MLNNILVAAQIIGLLVIGVLLFQIWYFFRRKDNPADEPLEEERVNYLTQRLAWISICAAAEIVLQLAVAIVRFLEAK